MNWAASMKGGRTSTRSAARYKGEEFHQLPLHAAQVTEIPKPGDYKLLKRWGPAIIAIEGRKG